MRETSQNQQQAVCRNEKIDLFHCVRKSPYDQDQCLSLFQAWRQCVIDKKVKKLSQQDEQTREEADSRGKRKRAKNTSSR